MKELLRLKIRKKALSQVIFCGFFVSWIYIQLMQISGSAVKRKPEFKSLFYCIRFYILLHDRHSFKFYHVLINTLVWGICHRILKYLIEMIYQSLTSLSLSMESGVSLSEKCMLCNISFNLYLVIISLIPWLSMYLSVHQKCPTERSLLVLIIMFIPRKAFISASLVTKLWPFLWCKEICFSYNIRSLFIQINGLLKDIKRPFITRKM